MMFRFSANEQLLADWVQWQNQPEGLFPIDKGWEIKFQLKSPRNEEPSFFYFQAKSKSESIVLVPVSASSCKDILSCVGQSLKKGDLLVVLCGESVAEQVTLQISRSTLPESTLLLGLGEEGMKTYRGTWENSRLEFRLSKQSTLTWDIPHQIPLNPGLLEDEILLSRCFVTLFNLLTQSWLKGKSWVSFEELLQSALPLYTLLPKPDRRRASGLIYRQFEQLIQGPMQDWLELRSYSKKPQSAPVLRLNFLVPPAGRGAVLKQLRKQSQAIHLIRNQALQTSYYDIQVNSF